MKKNKILLLVYTAAALILGTVGAYFRYVLINECLEPVDGDASKLFYKAGTALPEAFWIFVAACLLFALSPLVLTRKDKLPDEAGGQNAFASAVCAITGIAMLLSAAVFFFGTDLGAIRIGDAKTLFVFELLRSLFAILSFLFFMIEAFSKWFDSLGKNMRKIRDVCSMLPVIWAVLHLMAVYFDKTLLLNSPIRTVHQTALAFLVFFTLVDARMHVGKHKPGLFTFVSLFSLVFLCIWTFPELSRLVSEGDLVSLGNINIVAEASFILLIAGRLVSYALSFSSPEYIEYSEEDFYEGYENGSDGGSYGDDNDTDGVLSVFSPEEEEKNEQDEDFKNVEYLEESEVVPESGRNAENEIISEPEETPEISAEERNEDIPDPPAKEEITSVPVSEENKEETKEEENVSEDDQLTFDEILKDDPEETGDETETVSENASMATEETPENKEETPEEKKDDDPVRTFIEELGKRLDYSVASEGFDDGGERTGKIPPETGDESFLEIKRGEVEGNGEEKETSEKLDSIDVSNNEILKFISELTGEKVEGTRPETAVKKPEDEIVDPNKSEFSEGEILSYNLEMRKENRGLKSRNYRDVFNDAEKPEDGSVEKTDGDEGSTGN